MGEKEIKIKYKRETKQKTKEDSLFSYRSMKSGIAYLQNGVLSSLKWAMRCAISRVFFLVDVMNVLC